jgi:hypothetical protein
MHYLQTEFEARDRQEELLREVREPGYEVGSEEVLPRPAERAKISGTS